MREMNWTGVLLFQADTFFIQCQSSSELAAPLCPLTAGVSSLALIPMTLECLATPM